MRRDLFAYLTLSILGIIFFIPFLGAVHLFDWDEINFAEAAREMLITKDYLRVQIDFLPFWEKPPLFIWLQALAMKVFGVNEFAARLPNALAGIATLLTLYYIGRKLKNEFQGWLWAILYLGSWLPHFYFKTAIIDPIFNLFIFLSFYQVYLSSIKDKKFVHNLYAALFLGLAVLTKGPVAILIAVLALGAYIIWNKGLWGLGFKTLIHISWATVLVAGSWFLIDIAKNGLWFTETFIQYQIRLFSTEDAGHRGPFYYHFLVLLIGVFPASVFVWKRKEDQIPKSNQDYFTVWMWLMLLVTLILFSIVKTKIVHYSSLCYFPITYLAAKNLSHYDYITDKTKKIYKGLFIGIGSIWSILLLALPILGNHLDKLIPLIDDPFAVANLDANPNFSYALLLLAFLFIAALIFAVAYKKLEQVNRYLIFTAMSAVVINLTMLFYTPKVEQISQNAAIEFFKSFQREYVYVQPIGYKSYAHLFYTQRANNHSEDYKQNGTSYLLSSDTDRAVYFITKNIYLERILAEHPQLTVLSEKNGYVFLTKKESL